MGFFLPILAAILLSGRCSARWLGVPTVPFLESENGGAFSLDSLKSIVVDSNYQDSVDSSGETLIPPTLMDFATTFSTDLASIFDLQIPVITSTQATSNSIFITLSNADDYLDAAGRPTSEGYSINVTSEAISIIGASSLGAWWATRSILQQAVLGNLSLTYGTAKDSPGWGTRGIMLDCGRHFYPPDFLIEMCSWMSYFKQNTFHLHLSDNLGLNSEMLSFQRQMELYASFRPNSDDPALAGLSNRPNESYYQSDFEEIQQKCASRGVTIIPELESPGHSLVITQWKPELALETDFTLLNLSNPETTTTMKQIWGTFLPWFHSKTVHIGADEYTSTLVSEYNDYVHDLDSFISDSSTNVKSTRIWGTFPPSQLSNITNIDLNVSIQHWDFSQANPYFDFIKNGYQVLNSDDAFYADACWSGSFPTDFNNLTKIFHGAPDGSAYAPNIFSTTNATDNPPRDEPLILGQIAAFWNDLGPNATSYIEAFYAFREGIPALSDKQWGGDLTLDEYTSIIPALQSSAPGQNLDRRVKSKTSTIMSYDFALPLNASGVVVDKSGNGYNGLVKGCSIRNSTLQLQSGCSVETPLFSKGRNYTLSFSVKPTSSTPGTLFSGSASSLLAGNGSIDNVMLVTAGNPYILNYSLPLEIFTQVSLIGMNNATFLSVIEAGREKKTFEFTSTIGYYSNSFIWGNPMAIEAPIAKIGGDSFEGLMKDVVLMDGADEEYATIVAPLVIGVWPYES